MKAGNATTYARHIKKQLLMLTRKRYEFFYKRTYGLHSSLHGRNTIRLPLQTSALSPNCTKFPISQQSSSTAVLTLKVASKHKNFIRFQNTDIFWCKH